MVSTCPRDNVKYPDKLQFDVLIPPASVTVGVKVVAWHNPPPTVAVVSAGHVIAGGMRSTTVTENKQLVLKPATLTAVQFTVVVPSLNVDPLETLHETVGMPSASVAPTL